MTASQTATDPVEQRREDLQEMDDTAFLQALADRDLRISTLAETVLEATD